MKTDTRRMKMESDHDRVYTDGGQATYHATVEVQLKDGIADPEADETQKALERRGHSEVNSVKFSEQYEIELEAGTEKQAEERVEEMTEDLLANPTMHDYEIEVEELG